MSIKPMLASLMISALLLVGCDYIVLPEEINQTPVPENKGWTAVATQIGAGDTGLRIDVTIQNQTGNWSAMQAADKAAVLSSADGTTNCETVFVSTGGHRLAPGFQMRGYTGGTKAEPVTQLLYVECAGASADGAAELKIDYTYVIGDYDYYDQEATKADAVLTVNLAETAADLTYPIMVQQDGVVLTADTAMTGINEYQVSLLGAARTDTGLELQWEATNPSDYPGYIHIGLPPVIGSDGIVYGLYESPDLSSPPVVPAKGASDWTTAVAVPEDVSGLYVLTPVESKKQRTFVFYVIDLTEYLEG